MHLWVVGSSILILLLLHGKGRNHDRLLRHAWTLLLIWRNRHSGLLLLERLHLLLWIVAGLTLLLLELLNWILTSCWIAKNVHKALVLLRLELLLLL